MPRRPTWNDVPRDRRGRFAKRTRQAALDAIKSGNPRRVVIGIVIGLLAIFVAAFYGRGPTDDDDDLSA